MTLIRFLIASFGGYIFSALASVTLAFVLPFENKFDSVELASMLSFIIWLLFILYAFSSVKLKSLFLQCSLISINLFLINTCLMAVKG